VVRVAAGSFSSVASVSWGIGLLGSGTGTEV